MNTKNETIYILGHSPAEIQRLKNQAEILRPITERLLLTAGIGCGMGIGRVLRWKLDYAD